MVVGFVLLRIFFLPKIIAKNSVVFFLVFGNLPIKLVGPWEIEETRETRMKVEKHTPWKFNIALKIRHPKRKVVFQPSFFRGYVKLRGVLEVFYDIWYKMICNAFFSMGQALCYDILQKGFPELPKLVKESCWEKHHTRLSQNCHQSQISDQPFLHTFV